MKTQKFSIIQKLKTHGAMDVKYFWLKSEKLKRHFLVVANSFDHKQTSASNALIYEFTGEKFIPFQILYLNAKIMKFLPVLVSLNQKLSKSSFPHSCSNYRVKLGHSHC